MLEIREIYSNRDLKKFVKFPLTLYKDSPYFVPGLISDELSNLRADKNPAFEYCEAKYFLAERDGKVVGRIGAILNKAANEKNNQKRLRITRFDFIDDHDVSELLIKAVEKWAKQIGMSEIVGPIGFCDLDKEGMLIEGFDKMAMFITIYNYPYYQEHMEKLGFQKDVDWIEFLIKAETARMDKIDRICQKVLQKYDLHIVEIKNKRKVKPYIPKFFDIINEAFRNIYGTVEITKAQVDFYVSQFLLLIDLDYLCIIEDSQNKIVGMGLAVPTMSEASRKARGRLMPLGFIHILKALKFGGDTLDLYSVAVTDEYRAKGIPAILLNEITKKAIANGIKYAETGPELELNTKVQSLWTNYETEQHKRRRCYIKAI